MAKRFISCSLFLLLFLFVSGQRNFRPAIVVNSNGDTLRGFINDREWLLNPEAFSFKKSLTDEESTTLDKSNAKYVSIEGERKYELFITKVSMNEIRYELYSKGLELPDVMDTIFLRKIASGDNINLYSYRDKMKTRFYVFENTDKTLSELGYGISVQGNQVLTLYPYRKQLLDLAEKFLQRTDEIQKLVSSSSYTGQQLVKVVNRINGITDEEQSKINTSGRRTRFFIGGGINLTNLKYKGVNLVNADGLDSDGNIKYKSHSSYTSVLPKISVGLDYIFKPSVQSFLLRAELMTSAIRTDLTSTYQFGNNVDEILTNNYKLFGLIVGLSPQLIWNCYNKENFKVYLGAGPSGRLIFYPEKTLYQTTNKSGEAYSDKEIDNYFKLKNTFVNVMLKAGVTINKKMDASLSWYSGMELTNYATPKVASIRENPVHLNFYYFLKSK